MPPRPLSLPSDPRNWLAVPILSKCIAIGLLAVATLRFCDNEVDRRALLKELHAPPLSVLMRDLPTWTWLSGRLKRDEQDQLGRPELRVSMLRAQMLMLVAGVVLLGGVSSGAALSRWSPKRAPHRSTTKAHRRHPGTDHHRRSLRPSKGPVTYSGLCGGALKDLPGAGASTWAAQAFYDLWLGPGEGVGAEIGGCPGLVHTVVNEYQTVQYKLGRLDGQLRSVAIVSQRGTSAIFLNDGGATQYVLGRLLAGVAVSGSSRVNIGNGDFQLVYDGSGTTTLIRMSKHLFNHPSVAAAYTVLTPIATEIWLDLMASQSLWLWPTSLGSRHGQQLIGLSTHTYGPPLETIIVETPLSATLQDGPYLLHMDSTPEYVFPSEILRFAPAVGVAS